MKKISNVHPALVSAGYLIPFVLIPALPQFALLLAMIAFFWMIVWMYSVLHGRNCAKVGAILSTSSVVLVFAAMVMNVVDTQRIILFATGILAILGICSLIALAVLVSWVSNAVGRRPRVEIVILKTLSLIAFPIGVWWIWINRPAAGQAENLL